MRLPLGCTYRPRHADESGSLGAARVQGPAPSGSSRARVRALALRTELDELFFTEELVGDLYLIEGKVPLNQVEND